MLALVYVFNLNIKQTDVFSKIELKIYGFKARQTYIIKHIINQSKQIQYS